MSGGRWSVAIGAVSAVVLAGCASQQQFAEGAGTVTGAIAGAVIGERIGGKQGQLAGILIGAVIGNMIGREIGRSLSEPDRQSFRSHMALGLTSGKDGQSFEWANAQSGAQAKYAATSLKQVNAPMRVHRASKVEAPGPFTIIGQPYATKRAEHVRSSPNAGAPSLEKLKAGSVVIVNGQMTGTDWYLVGRGGTAIGYMPVASLKPSGAGHTPSLIVDPAKQMPPPSGDAVPTDVVAQTTCRDVTYEVMTNGSSAEQGNFESCKLPTGDWMVKG